MFLYCGETLVFSVPSHRSIIIFFCHEIYIARFLLYSIVYFIFENMLLLVCDTRYKNP